MIGRMPSTTFPNGVVITTHTLPPSSFDIAKATDQNRSLYGLPRFTAGSAALERIWLSKARGLRFVQPEFKPREMKRRKLPGLTPGHGTETTAIWSGGVT